MPLRILATAMVAAGTLLGFWIEWTKMQNATKRRRQ